MRYWTVALLVLILACHALAQPTTSKNVTDPSQIEKQEEKDESVFSFSILLILGLLLVTFLIGYVLRETNFKYLHESGAGIILGIAVGAIIRSFASEDRLKQVAVFDPEFFFLIILPPIIFDAGYNMKRGHFFYNFGSIVSFAFIGTLVSAFSTAGILIAVKELGWVKLAYFECFIFGALISATDPVTVLSIFKQLGVDDNLYANVFGESVLNDAVAIALYRTIANYAGGSGALKFTSILSSVLDFSRIFFGSFFIAVITGLLASLLFKHTKLHKFPILESAIFLIYAYCSYLLAEGLRLSGIVAILFHGIVMAHYTYNNLSRESQNITRKSLEVIAFIAEIVVFIFLGMAIFSFGQDYDPAMIAVSILAILLTRAIHIFPLSLSINCLRKEEHRIKWRDATMLWFSGLRGAIAFALALNARLLSDHGSKVLTTTLVIVVATVIILGGLTKPMVDCLKIKKIYPRPKYDPIAVLRQKEFVRKNISMRFDRLYLKPFFTRAKVPGTTPAPGSARTRNIPLSNITINQAQVVNDGSSDSDVSELPAVSPSATSPRSDVSAASPRSDQVETNIIKNDSDEAIALDDA